MTKKTVKVLRVSSRSGNFRRAGLAFGTEPQDLPLAALSKAARAALVNEPMLVALEVEVGAEDVAGVDDMPAASEPATTKPAKAEG